jgi:hypothetical protein
MARIGIGVNAVRRVNCTSPSAAEVTAPPERLHICCIAFTEHRAIPHDLLWIAATIAKGIPWDKNRTNTCDCPHGTSPRLRLLAASRFLNTILRLAPVFDVKPSAAQVYDHLFAIVFSARHAIHDVQNFVEAVIDRLIVFPVSLLAAAVALELVKRERRRFRRLSGGTGEPVDSAIATS